MIQDDVGGNLVAYAQRVSLIHLSGRPVALAGRCDSACTLYLSLPRSQNCVLEGVSFGFHEAFGGRPDMNAWGTRYLLDAYPEWVHDWLERRGGLGLELKRMPYTEAARHLRKCPDRKADAG